MNCPYCLNRSPRTMAEAVEAALPAAGIPRLTRRPYNHYKPTLTSWYMVPSLELPFFKFGKFSFRWDENVRDTISCGYLLTKGLDPALRAVYTSRKGRRYIMDDSWVWHSFLPALRSGEVASAIRRMLETEGIAAEFIVSGGYVDDPGIFDPDQENRRRDCYRLSCDIGGKVRVVKADRSAMVLKMLNKATDLGTFAAALEEIGRDQFLWCDIFLGAAFKIKPAELEVSGEPVFDGAMLWSRILTPYLPWVK